MRIPPLRLAPAFVTLSLVLCAPMAHAAVVPGDALGPATSTDVILLVVYLGLAIFLSFLCSVAEATLLSVTPSFIEGLKESRPELARTLKRLREEKIDQSLAAILTLNTIAHTAGAVGAGAKAAVVFGSAWVGAFSVVATLLILFLSEIVPKTIGALHWRSLAGPTALFVRWMIVALYPLIKVSEAVTKIISGGKQSHVFSREELIAMANIGEQGGHLDQRESRILTNLFQMSQLKSRDVMTPRTVVEALQREMTVDDAIRQTRVMAFSRLPLYTENLDDAEAFVLKDDLLHHANNGGGDWPVEKLSRKLATVPGNVPLTKLLELLLDERQHIALVVGEHGESLGLVTLEDVVETLLGDEIVDEVDRVSDMRELATQRYKRRAALRGSKPRNGR